MLDPLALHRYAVRSCALKRGDPLDFYARTTLSHYLDIIPAYSVAEAEGLIMRTARNKGIPFKVVDIGGGFPIKHFETDTHTVATFARLMRRELDRIFPKDVEIIAEPGRALSGPAGMLISCSMKSPPALRFERGAI